MSLVPQDGLLPAHATRLVAAASPFDSGHGGHTGFRGLPPAPQLVCVSTTGREHANEDPGDPATSGIAAGLDSALRELGGTWIAPGPAGDRTKSLENGSGRTYDCLPLTLSAAEIKHDRDGFGNAFLWPILHCITHGSPYEPDGWDRYVRLNRRYADATASELAAKGAAPTVAWFHDHPLMLAPRFVRDIHSGSQIGFHLRTPFPAFEIFRILPMRRELLDGMLGADLIGLPSAGDVESFLGCVRRLLGAAIDRNGVVDYRKRRTRIIVSPAGLDYDKQTEIASNPQVASRAERLRKSIGVDRLLVSVDRLDISRGIPERLAGFERLLERHAQHRGHVALAQVIVPPEAKAADSRELKRMVDAAVDRVNARFGTSDWTPVHTVARGLQPIDLAAYYRAADVAVITPLRAGIDLAPKEYVASRPSETGALVLSEFSAIADELPSAYFANPFGPDSLSDAMHAALTDELPERARRMSALQSRVRSNDLHHWANAFAQNIARGA